MTTSRKKMTTPRKRQHNRFANYQQSVFVNCPFDTAYTPIFRSLVFTVIRCGFRARCALEIDDGSQVRIEKIFSIIEECRFGIHDLSRTELDKKTKLPRFNMPLELGMFLGIKRAGDLVQKSKVCLVFDRDRYRYQAFVSDIAGQDIRAHGLDEAVVVSLTRNWLRSWSPTSLPGGREILRQYRRFAARLPILCRRLKLDPSEMTYNDFIGITIEWLTVELSESIVENRGEPVRVQGMPSKKGKSRRTAGRHRTGIHIA